MSEPDTFILTLLREIRAEIESGRHENRERFDAHDRRFNALDAKIESLKQAMHGESVLGRYASAKFEDRIEAIEKPLEKLEKGH